MHTTLRRCAALGGRCGNTGIHVLTMAEVEDGAAPYATHPGDHVCSTHAPRSCRHCGQRTAWFDGSVCDWCDRYDDDGGADD